MLPKVFPQPTERRIDAIEDEDSALGATADDEGASDEEDDSGSGTIDDDDFSKIVDEETISVILDEDEISTASEENPDSTEEEISRIVEDEEIAKFPEDIARLVLTEDDSADGEKLSLTPEEDSADNPCVASWGIADTELSSQFQIARAIPSKQNDLRCRFI